MGSEILKYTGIIGIYLPYFLIHVCVCVHFSSISKTFALISSREPESWGTALVPTSRQAALMDLANASSFHRVLPPGKNDGVQERAEGTRVARLSLSVQTIGKPAMTVKLEILAFKWAICEVEEEITFSLT